MDVLVAFWHERAARYFRNQVKMIPRSREDARTEAQRRLTWHEAHAQEIWSDLGVNLINMKGQWVK